MADRVIEVVLRGTDQSFSASLRGATTETERFTSRITAMSTGFLAARQILQDVAGAVDAVVGSQVRAARELQAFSNRLGISSQVLAELKFVAEQNNVAFSQMAIGMQRATRRVAEAAKGMGEAQGALRELNLDARRLVNLSPDQQFDAIAEALQGVEGQADRVRLAFKLFDSEGVAMLQLFDEANSSIAETRDRFRELNPTMSEGFVDAADKAARKAHEVSTAFKGIGTAITDSLIKGLGEDGLSGLTEMFVAMGKVVGTTTRIVVETGTRERNLAVGAGEALSSATQAGAAALWRWLENLANGPLEGSMAGGVPGIAGAGFQRPGGSGMVMPGPILQPVGGGRAWLDSQGRGLGTPADLMAAYSQMPGFQPAGPRSPFDAGPVGQIGPVLDTLREVPQVVDEEIITSFDRWKASTEELADTLGERLVDSVFQLTDSIAVGFADALTGVRSFTDAMRQAFTSFVRDAIAMFAKLILQMLAVRILAGLGVPEGLTRAVLGVGSSGGAGAVAAVAGADGSSGAAFAPRLSSAAMRYEAAPSAPSPMRSGGLTLNISAASVMGGRAEALAFAGQIGHALVESGYIAPGGARG